MKVEVVGVVRKKPESVKDISDISLTLSGTLDWNLWMRAKFEAFADPLTSMVESYDGWRIVL